MKNKKISVEKDLGGLTGLDTKKTNRPSRKRTPGKNKLVLANKLITRAFDFTNGFQTVELAFSGNRLNLVDPQTTCGPMYTQRIESFPCRELRIAVNGNTTDIGTDGKFQYQTHTLQKDRGITTLEVRLSSTSPAFRGLELTIYYQIHEKEAFTIKWTTLKNLRRKNIIVNNCQPEVLSLPAPFSRWQELERKVHPTFHPRSPELHVFDYWRYDFSPETNAPVIWIDTFTSQDKLYGFTMCNDYVAIARGAEDFINPPREDDNRPLLSGSIVSRGRSMPQEVYSQYPYGPEVVLKPGETFKTFRTYMTFFEGGVEDASLSLHRMTRKLCPWINDYFSLFGHKYWQESVSKQARKSGKFNPAPLKKTIDQAAEVGFDFWRFDSETWVQGFGTFEPRPEFPNGTSDMNQISDYIHSSGMKTALYFMGENGQDFDVLYVTDKNGNCLVRDIGTKTDFLKRHPEMVLKIPEGKESYSAMCSSGGWHEYRLGHLKRLIKEIGVDLVTIDGPYYGDMCHSTGHKHHTPAESQYLNRQCQVEVYDYLSKKGIPFTSADFHQSLFHGNRGFPTIHAETGSCNDPYKFACRVRECMYISTRFTPNTSLKYSVFADKNIMPDNEPLDDYRFLDHYFASVCLYGTNLSLLADTVYRDPKSKKIVKKWLDFRKKYKPILTCDVIHLGHPHGEHIDAIAHVDFKGTALVAAFNPTDIRLSTEFVLPAKYMNNAGTVTVSKITGKKSWKIRARKDKLPVSIRLEAQSYAVYLIN